MQEITLINDSKVAWPADAHLLLVDSQTDIALV